MSIFELQSTRLAQDELGEAREEGRAEEQAEGEPYYGKLIVLVKRPVHISVGPDYVFTIFAVFFLSLISFALYKFSTMLGYGPIGKVINFFFVFVPPLSFMITAFSNPGVYQPYQNDDPKIKYCETCKVFKPKRVYHCPRCDLCIEGYDHHCPWMSKCIGSKNLKSFYLFILSLPAAFLYFGFMIYTAVVMQKQINANAGAKH